MTFLDDINAGSEKDIETGMPRLKGLAEIGYLLGIITLASLKTGFDLRKRKVTTRQGPVAFAT